MDYRCLVFTLTLYPLSLAGFAEIPSSVIVEFGTVTPPFRCRHMSSNALITWRVNGSPVGQFPDIRSASVNESGNIVHTLTVPDEPAYNGTVVECVAAFVDGTPTEVTPTATVIYTPTLPTSSIPSYFEMTPSPLAVAVEQGTATFRCQHSFADDINWLVNGTSLNRVHSPDVYSSVQFQGSVTTYTLSIGTLVEYNETTIECVAIFLDGSPSLLTAPVTLFVQDTPGQIQNAGFQRDYSFNTLTTFWDPLPTLDLNNTDPDIVYTVQLLKMTCGQSTLINQTTVAGSNATVENLDMMQIYKATVAARNNAREARNGKSVIIEETFMLLSGTTLFNLARYSQVNITSLDPVPSFYVIVLESLDGHGSNLVVNVTVHRNQETISVFLEDELPSKSLWNASVLANGCETNTHTTVTELSTHVIQNVTVNSLLTGQIRVRGDFVDGSTATGVLLIIYSLTDDSNVHYIAKRKEKESEMFDASVNGLPGTWYGISVYALENQLLFPRVVASPKFAAIDNDDQGTTSQLVPIEYELHTTSTDFCITCTFLDGSTTDCVAVVHQRISQLSSRGLMNIESSHKFNRSGDTAYGCIERIDMEQYQVGVVEGRRIVMIPYSSVPRSFYCLGCIVGISCAAILGAVILVGIAITLLFCCIKELYSCHGDTKSPGESEENVEMQRCGAYEVVRLSRQQVTMSDNPAYVDVTLA